MKRALSLATFLVATVAALDAHADLLNWSLSSVYDSGASPTVARGTTQYGAWAVEVHQGTAGAGPLWYRSGMAPGNGRPTLQNAQQFDWGFAPSVATINTDQNAPRVLEVHQGQAGAGLLWYSVGAMTNLQSPGVLSWSGANAYDSGFAPSIAASGTTVVELHQTQATASQMMYQVGTVTGSGVAWSSPYAWEWGAAPSVAIANTPYGTYVVEVHQGGQGFGPLWYSIGTISGSSITWTPSAIYDYGVAPRLAVFEDRILEVHQSGTGVSPLWYHLGTISGPFQSYPVPSTPVAWDANPHEYATGLAPAIAFDPLSIDGYEVHQQSAGLGAMVEVPFTTRPAVPAYAQAEGQWCWATVAEMIVQTLHGLNLANEPSAAAELECQAVNTHERLSGIGNNGGTFLDCCGPGAFDSTTWRYCECNRGGWYGGVLQESGVTFTDYQAPIKFTQVASEIANGRPVPVGFNWNPPGTGGHYMLITGTEVDGAGRSWAVVNDPSGGTQWIFNYLMLANTSTASPWPFSVNEMSTNMTAH